MPFPEEASNKLKKQGGCMTVWQSDQLIVEEYPGLFFDCSSPLNFAARLLVVVQGGSGRLSSIKIIDGDTPRHDSR